VLAGIKQSGIPGIMGEAVREYWRRLKFAADGGWHGGAVKNH
jgi:hypothetical protein